MIHLDRPINQGSVPHATGALCSAACTALLALVVVGTSFVSQGCGHRQQVDVSNYTEAAERAFERAENAFRRKDFELARSLYTEVYQNFPYSQYASISEFRIADCHFYERRYVRAVDAYRRFIRFHPTHERVAEAHFQVAMSFVKQMPGDWFMMPPSYERELREAESAYQTLGLFLENFGHTEFAEEARYERARILDRLASHELYVAEFYFRRDNARAAASRCEYLLNRYPNASQVPQALFLYARAMLQLGDVDQAVSALRRLRTEFADTELGVRAEEYLVMYGF